MTYEEAYYHRLLIECGITEEFDKYLSARLESENPLSELTYDLAECFSDYNKILSVLSNRINKADKIDGGAVFDFVWRYLNKLYANGLSRSESVILMNKIAANSGFVYESKLWMTMGYMQDYMCDSDDGLIDKKNFDICFDRFISEKICINPWDLPREQKRPSIWQKIKNMFKRK